MVEVEYSLGDEIERAKWNLPSYRYAVIANGRIVLRKRSNGQTFELFYRTRSHANRGLGVALLAIPEAELWDRDQGS